MHLSISLAYALHSNFQPMDRDADDKMSKCMQIVVNLVERKSGDTGTRGGGRGLVPLVRCSSVSTAKWFIDHQTDQSIKSVEKRIKSKREASR